VNELVTNAFKHAFPDGHRGEIVVGLEAEAGAILVTVADDGVGLPSDERLADTKSLGLQLVPLLVEQLRGQIAIERDGGTRFRLRIPV
jgi:two-component sensor histidine kinase